MQASALRAEVIDLPATIGYTERCLPRTLREIPMIPRQVPLPKGLRIRLGKTGAFALGFL
jgi:hypothetical protein